MTIRPQPNAANIASPQSLLIDLEETATQLSLSLSTIKLMVRAGQLPGVRRIGRRVLIHRLTLEQWINNGCPPLDESQPARRKAR